MTLQAQERERWIPDRNEQLAAVEIPLASTLSYEARLVLRELEQKLAERKSQ